MTIKDSIRTAIEGGCIVSYNFKIRYDDWYCTIKIRKNYFNNPPVYNLYSDHSKVHDLESPDLDPILDRFCDAVFSPKNLALVAQGVKKHQLGELDFEPHQENKDQINKIVKQYQKDFFHQDFPEFAKTTQ